MKTWKNPTVEELNMNLTSQGGSDRENPDKDWTDIKTGEAWTSYASGGDLGGDPVIVTPVN